MTESRSFFEKIRSDCWNGLCAFFIVLEQGNSRKLIYHIGLIAAPATLVALCGQFFGMSSRDNAAVCLGVTFFFALFRYRDYVDNRLRATWALTALGVFVALNYYVGSSGVSDVELRDTGLSRYYVSANDFLGEAITEQFQSTENEFLFVGTSFHITGDLKKTAGFGDAKTRCEREVSGSKQRL